MKTTYMKCRERYAPLSCETRTWSGQHPVYKTTQGISWSQMSRRGITYRQLEQGWIWSTIDENLVQARGINYIEWTHGLRPKIKGYFLTIVFSALMCSMSLKLIIIFHWQGDVWNQALNVSGEIKFWSVQEKAVCTKNIALPYWETL